MLSIEQIKNNMKETYRRCIALDIPAKLDGIQYIVDENDKIIFVGIDKNYINNTLIINDIFDRFAEKCFFNFISSIHTIIYDKVDDLNLSIFNSVNYPFKLVVSHSCQIHNCAWMDNFVISVLYMNELELYNVEVIESKCFCNAMLKQVYLGKVHTIYDMAFNNCSDLREIDLSKVTYIGENAFSKTKIKKADLRSIECIITYSFFDCTDLEEVILSSKCKYVENGAFCHCKNFKKVSYIGTKEEWLNLSKNINHWKDEKGKSDSSWYHPIFVKFIHE